MTVAQRIAAGAGLLAILAFLAGFLVLRDTSQFYLEELTYRSLDAHSAVVADLWEASGGCDAPSQSDFGRLTRDFVSVTGFAYAISCKDGSYRTASDPFPETEPVIQALDPTFSYVENAFDNDWFVVGRTTDGAVIQVAMVDDLPLKLFDELFGPPPAIALLLLILLAAAVFGLSRMALRPLSRLTDADWTGGAVGPLDLPHDLEPLRQKILAQEAERNDLVDARSAQLERERFFTANAAHELLTPLTALKTEVQLRQKMERREEMNSWLDGLLQRVNRATHTADQLMTLARLDRLERHGTDFTSVRLRPLLMELLDDIEVSDENAAPPIDRDISVVAAILGSPTLIAILIRNLLENAVKYVSPDGRISVTLTQDDGAVHLIVTNTVDRMPNYLVDQMFDRFIRGPDETETGTGLGLSIVKRIAELHGAEVSTELSADSTFRISALFPIS